MHASITGSIRNKWEAISNKVNIWHLIFNSNSTSSVETYLIPTKWLILGPRLKLHPLLPSSKVIKCDIKKYKDRRYPLRCLQTKMTRTVFTSLYPTFVCCYYFPLSCSRVGLIKTGTCVNLHLQRSTKWDQQPPTTNTTVTFMQQATLICYSIDEVIKLRYKNYKGKWSLSQCLATKMKKQVFQNFLSPLI